jgi:multidrug resistance efflux pump
MKKILMIVFLVLPVMIFGKVHYAKVEPYAKATIKSSVQGSVLKADQSVEGSVLGEGAFVQIDDTLDRENLKDTNESIKLFASSLKINYEILEGLKATLDRREEYYNRINGLDTASKTQKDNAYAAYIGTKNQYLGTKEKIITLKKQIADLRYKASILKDTISKKHISFPGKYLYRLMVSNGEFVAPGVPLAVIYDISKAKLIVYIDSDELDGIESRKVFVNGKETNLKINKIWKVADTQYISAYKVKLLLPPIYKFSQLLKIEFK